MHFGKNIKLIRQRWGLSQTEFGLLIGATRGMVTQYELRNSKPKSNTLTEVTKVTRLTQDVLFNHEIKDSEIGDLSLSDQILIANYRENPSDYDDLTKELKVNEHNDLEKASQLLIKVLDYLERGEYKPTKKDLLEMLELKSAKELTEIFERRRFVSLKPFKGFITRFENLLPDHFLEEFLELYPTVAKNKASVTRLDNEQNSARGLNKDVLNSLFNKYGDKYNFESVTPIANYVSIDKQDEYVKSDDKVKFASTLFEYSLPPGTPYQGVEWRYFQLSTSAMSPLINEKDVGLFTLVYKEDWQSLTEHKVCLIITDNKFHFGRPESIEEYVFIMGDSFNNYSEALIPLSNISEVWELRRIIAKPSFLFMSKELPPIRKRKKDALIKRLQNQNDKS